MNDPTEIAPNRIRSAWALGRPIVAGWMQSSCALTAETLASCGYDSVVLDLQHSGTDLRAATAMMTAIQLAGVEPMVRLRWNSADSIGQFLDMGAAGVIVPMIETEADAAAFASAIHYPPRGARSFGARRPMLRYGPGYFDIASETIVSFAMIETRKGFDNLDAILAVDGIDGIFIGPTDLSIGLGGRPTAESDDPEFVAAVSEIRDRCFKAGRKVGMYCGSATFARSKISEGFDLVTMPPDLAMMAAAARAGITEVRRG